MTQLRAIPQITVKISPGEWADRHSILRIKSRKLLDGRPQDFDLSSIQQIGKQLQALEKAAPELVYLLMNTAVLCQLYHLLWHINEQLWTVEDALRLNEKAHIFDNSFIRQAREVYKLNDQRSLLKNKITAMFEGGEAEIKLYPEYEELTDARKRLDEASGPDPS